MIYMERWKIWVAILVSVWGILYALPNIVTETRLAKWQEVTPSFFPSKQVNLGLDLRGGSHLLLQVEMDKVVKDRMDSVIDEIRRGLRRERIGYTGLSQSREGVVFSLRDVAETDKALSILREIQGDFDIRSENGKLSMAFTEKQKRDFQAQVISQSIEIVRRRIDETGTREPVIQAQGTDRILVQLPGVDDPERIKDLLGKTAKLTFNMVDTTASMTSVPPSSVVYPSLDNPEQRVVVSRRALITGEMLVDAQPTFQEGAPVVSFRFDSTGSRRFCEVTRENVGKPFAIVLDNAVISSPVIRDAICGGSGIISGGFTVQSANDLALLLRAGALPAPLLVIEERTIGPSLGVDSIEAGKVAALIAVVAVVAFMIISYGLFGLFANIALFINIALIIAVLSALQATLTLPGIAGIVLTIGMAVDANVLIFERIREEHLGGRTIISAIDAGYKRALSTIIDANFTTLIAALFLFAFGTGPVKGFAVTLAIGILTSMFSAIMLTYQIVVLWHNKTKAKTLPL